MSFGATERNDRQRSASAGFVIAGLAGAGGKGRDDRSVVPMRGAGSQER
jgi:hypothetical protein